MSSCENWPLKLPLPVYPCLYFWNFRL